MKKFMSILLVLVMSLALVACANTDQPADKTGSGSTDKKTDENEVTPDPEGNQTYAIITKSAGNPFNEREASGFEQVIKDAGYKAIIKHPAEITAEAQISLINELVAQKVDGIAVAANDYDALESALSAAMKEGIKVVTLDSSANGNSRQVHINQAGVTEVGQALVDAVQDLTGGSGQWAILSATSTATNQNAWIDAMQTILEDEKYADLDLVEIAYGDDQYQKSVDQTIALLNNYPDIKVICVPTTVGMAAAAKVITDEGLQGKVFVTGLGLPSEMAEFMGEGNVATPYMFLWNPIDVGSVAAYSLIEMVNGNLTGALGESFTAANGKTYTVTEAQDKTTEIIIGSPFKFDASNIEEWKNVY